MAARGRSETFLVTKVTDGERSRKPDDLIVEEPMTVQLDGVTVSTTMRTPGNDYELAVGFCHTEGLLVGLPVAGVRYCANGSAAGSEFNVVSVDTGGRAPAPRPRLGNTTSSCGLCGNDAIDDLCARLAPLPSLLMAVAIMAILGPGLGNAMIAIALVSLPAYVRLVRASAMSELKRDYVTAARLSGARTLRLMFVTVLPNCAAPLIVHATMSFSAAILEIAALGFLGLGVQPPLPEWGTMLASARDYIESAWWVVTLPGLTILWSVLAINLVGDGLRDALDPKLKSAS